MRIRFSTPLGLLLPALVLFHAACGDEPAPPTGTGGAASVAAGVGGTGGGGGNAMVCEPWVKKPCYTGPTETRNVGDCADGFSFCNAVGTDWSYCEADVTPSPEDCARPGDEDCDGMANEGCP